MKLLDLLKAAEDRLFNKGIKTPRLDAEVLLCHLLEVERIQLHIYPEREISREICRKFWMLIEKRLMGMPIQYIVNRQEFMGLNFFVEEGVLIPRGDTEILVEEVIDLLNQYEKPQLLKVAEVGTGSGAISISLAVMIEKIRVYSIDVSEKALEVAKKNAIINKVDDKIKFILGDRLYPLMGDNLNEGYQLIVSNPPYIRSKEIENLGPEVKLYEPHLALDGGEDGLDFYVNITASARDLLVDNGWLAFEIGFDQGRDVENILKSNSFKDVRVIKDLAGLDRVVVGRWKP
ncbi:peptide chain release factor N(5)-glutamine methyltransferase [Alkaliphilus serpentinus]|uniref:Release factor glutamine methyltransferase n=1 Tax=Alkaliphilus serpentinus TaxID=1482731 RepID=A0A833HPI8_9FIRM|nr:peptide chain release factor N(5)-glutamine methyltransferase [Alkaliphilus serpentinus]KAB3530879.1 peptide chain release factor N(5)-glutamine methyltransferase [Alkaliphilus serpentinus]